MTIGKSTNIMIQDNCFAISEDEKSCKCLKELYCKKECCNFYRHKKEISMRSIEDSIRVYDKKYR